MRLEEISNSDQRVESGSKIHDSMKESRDRLLQQVKAFGARANFNLTLGLSFSITGAFLLVYFLINLGDNKDFIDFLMHFLPRISLILLIEVFSYFFLQLYKQGIGDIRYFQNEVTNIKSKYMAILLAQHMSPEKIDTVVQALSTTERNFLVSKGDRIVSEVIEAQIETSVEKYLSKFKDFVPKGTK